jgi:nucleotide-binding universal stress UspA family protein
LSTSIKIYGTRTSRFQLTEDFIKKFLDKAAVDYVLEEVTDIQQFLQNDVNFIPAVQIDNEIPIPLNNNGGFNRSLRKIIQEILEKTNYGKLERFIIPIDFSESSLNAYHYANRLARFNGEILTLAHIYASTSTDISQSLIVEPRLKKQREEQLKNLVNELNKEWVGSIMNANLVTGTFDVGFPGEKIVSMAKNTKAKYIIMSSSCDQNTIKKVFGSVSIDVMKNATCPVLIIPPTVVFSPIKKILFACENPIEDLLSLAQIEGIAKIFSSQIKVLHVRKKDTPPCDFDHKKIKSIGHLDIEFDQIESNNKKKAIKNYIAKNKIDLVVVKPKKRPFLENVFHRSVSKYLSIYSELPLMAIK